MLSDRVGVEGEGKGVIAQPHAHEPSPSSARSGERERGRGAHAPLAERKLRDRGFPWDVIVDRDDHDRWSIAELQGSQVGENWRIIADEEKVLPICRRGGFFLRRVCGEVCLMTVSSSTRACSSRDPFACTHDGVRLCGNILELVRTSKNSLIFVRWIMKRVGRNIFLLPREQRGCCEENLGSIIFERERDLSFFLFVASRRNSFCNN